MSPQIESILVKYLSRCATAEEMDILEKWIDSPEGKARFQQYVKTNYLINYSMNDPDTEQEVEELLKRIRRAKSFSHRFRTPYLRYAAAVVVMGMLLAGYFLIDRFGSSKDIQIQPVVVDNAIVPGTEKATLTLEDGSTVVLEEGTSFQSNRATSNGKELVYSKDQSDVQEIKYNYLTIPRGGQFFLTLEDGTQVWLNSETQLKYPVNFTDSESRQVELVYGEAYFDVSPSTEHNGSRFLVNHSEQTVEVLGTEFNIKAYTGESVIYTTLVEGKVALNYSGKTQKLLPNQQFRYNTRNRTATLSEVNVLDVASWKEGVFNFDGASLAEIMKLLERWYDMEVVFEDPRLKDVEYNGTINKKYKIEEILNVLMGTNTIRTYEIEQKTIVLK